MLNDKLVIFDIDGTLINEKNEEIVNLNNLYNFFKTQKIEFSFATGRSFLEYKKLNKIQTSNPVILLDGNLILHKNKIMCGKIKYEIFQRILNHFVSISIQHIYVETLNKIYCTKFQDKILFIKNFKTNRNDIVIVDTSEFSNLDIYRIYIWNAPKDIFENTALYIDLDIQVNNKWTFINQSAVGKGYAIEWLRKNFFENKVYIYSIGNSQNDISLFQNSDFSILVNSNSKIYNTDIFIRKLSDSNISIIKKAISNNHRYEIKKYD